MNHFIKQTISCLILILFTAVFIFGVFPVKGMAATEEQKIFDNAGILSSEELDKLEQLADKYSAKRGVNIFISTIDSNDVTDIEEYSNQFVEQHSGNAVVLSINMATRNVDIYPSNEIRQQLEVDRCSLIREKITPDLSKANYYDAFHTYIKKSNQYLGVKSGINPESILLKTWLHAIMALGIGGVAVGIMAYQSGGKITVGSGTYLDPSHSGLLNRQDNYVKTVTTKVKRPQSNNNSGGSGDNNSGGGNAHSSGSF